MAEDEGGPRVRGVEDVLDREDVGAKALDDNDDVSTVWDNSDISEAELEAAAAS